MMVSRCEASMIAGYHEQLVPYKVQDQELAFVQRAIDSSTMTSALKRRGSLSIWFDPAIVWHPLRRATGFVESLLRLAGLD